MYDCLLSVADSRETFIICGLCGVLLTSLWFTIFSSLGDMLSQEES